MPIDINSRLKSESVRKKGRIATIWAGGRSAAVKLNRNQTTDTTASTPTATEVRSRLLRQNVTADHSDSAAAMSIGPPYSPFVCHTKACCTVQIRDIHVRT